MKLAQYYLRLRNHYARQAIADEVQVTLDELAAVLDCTHRNVVLLLRRMAAEGWLAWEPKRGRGHRSTLRFHMRSEDMALQLARSLVERKDVHGALEQLNAAYVTSAAKAGFNEWLYDYFGYKSELRDRKKIDTLRFPLSQQIHTLDPAFIDYTSESHLVGQLFDSLVRISPLTQSVEPHLAHAWEADSDGCGWTLYLRKGVLFHHGREMEAGDVVYSLNRIRQAQVRSLYRWVHESIETIEALDPTTVYVRLRHRNELFLPFLATNRASIIPEDISSESPERFAKQPVGTGPFKLVQNDGTVCVLEAFPYYFQGRAHLDRVEIWNIPDLYDRPSLDSFQIMHNVRLPEDQTKAWSQVKQQGTTCKFITFNLLKQGVLSDPAVRRAVNAAIDRGKLIAALAGDVIAPADGFVGGGGTTAHEEFAAPSAAMNAVMHDAAETQPETTSLPSTALKLCTIPQYEADARLVQSICRESGIEVDITLLPLKQFKGEQRLEADLLLFAVMLDNDAELRLIDLYKSMQHHLDPELAGRLDQGIAGLLKEPSRPRRWAMLGELEQVLKEHDAIVFLYQKYLKTAFHPSVKGISLDSLGWVQFKDIWFAR